MKISCWLAILASLLAACCLKNQIQPITYFCKALCNTPIAVVYYCISVIALGWSSNCRVQIAYMHHGLRQTLCAICLPWAKKEPYCLVCILISKCCFPTTSNGNLKYHWFMTYAEKVDETETACDKWQSSFPKTGHCKTPRSHLTEFRSQGWNTWKYKICDDNIELQPKHQNWRAINKTTLMQTCKKKWGK